MHETVQPQELQQVRSLTSPLVASPVRAPNLFPQDQILDEIVDELFFLSRPENELIMDFVNVWDPAASFGGDGALTDDVHLGNILDKLLEE